MKRSEYFPFLSSFFSSRRCNDVPVQTKLQVRTSARVSTIQDKKENGSSI